MLSNDSLKDHLQQEAVSFVTESNESFTFSLPNGKWTVLILEPVEFNDLSDLMISKSVEITFVGEKVNGRTPIEAFNELDAFLQRALTGADIS